MEKTVAAIATPVGTGGVSVIRVSGADAIEKVNKIFTVDISKVNTHTVHYGFIKSGDKYIDEVLVTVMKAPKTFTGEDVVEIGTHGGIGVTNSVLNALISTGIEQAAAGEFTKRAFLNGKIDLSRAEAIIDIINSENTLSEQNAVNQLRGGLSKSIEGVRDELVKLAAHMQVSIDYPDEDLEEITTEQIHDSIIKACNRIKKLINSAEDGRIIKDGIRTVIVGKPNVGKSALMNYLAGYDKAIVTDIAGTTRDVIEENITLSGIPIKLIDTAGIHKTDDTVEKIGVERSMRSIEGADLVIVLIDLSCEPDEEDLEVLSKTKNTKRIIVGNKSDCVINKEAQKLCDILVSAKTGDGTDMIKDRISDMYHIGEIAVNSGEVITNMRHKASLIKADEALIRAGEAISTGIPQDLAAMDINAAIEALGEITGATVSEDIVSAVFANFCVGK